MTNLILVKSLFTVMLFLFIGSIPLDAAETATHQTDANPQSDDLRETLTAVHTMMAEKKMDEALSLIQKAYQSHPEDKAVLQLYATLLFWQNRPEEADALFQKLLKKDPKTAQLSAYKQNRVLIHVHKMQTLLSASPKKAVAYAESLPKKLLYNYDLHLLYLQSLIRSNSLQKAQEQARLFFNHFPESSEAEHLLADLLYWQGVYDESLKHYRALYKKDPQEVLQKRILEVEEAALEKHSKAEQIKYFRARYEKSDALQDALQLVHLYLETGALEPALQILDKLIQKYPRDLEIARLYMASLLNTFHKSEANHLLYKMDKEEREALKEKYPSLYCRTLVNKLEVGGFFFDYDDNRYEDNTLYIQYETPIKEYILVALLQETWRYGLRDTDLQADLYRAFKNSWWGYLTFSFSPEANFMPLFNTGGHLYKGIGSFELGFGYEYSHYRESDVHMFIPEYSFYFWRGFTWTQKLYIVPASDSYALVNQLGYESNCHYKLQLEYTWATSNERIENIDAFQNAKSNALRLSGEYRFNPEWTLGGALSSSLYATDVGDYRQDGLQLFVRRSW